MYVRIRRRRTDENDWRRRRKSGEGDGNQKCNLKTCWWPESGTITTSLGKSQGLRGLFKTSFFFRICLRRIRHISFVTSSPVSCFIPIPCLVFVSPWSFYAHSKHNSHLQFYHRYFTRPNIIQRKDWFTPWLWRINHYPPLSFCEWKVENEERIRRRRINYGPRTGQTTFVLSIWSL